MIQFRAVILGTGLLSFALVNCGGRSTPPSEAPPAPTVEAAPPPLEPAPVETSRVGANPEQPKTETAPVAAKPPNPEPLSDEQILMIADLVSTAEIDQARIAQNRAKDARVRKFAATMIDHHGKAKQKQAKLATKLKLKGAESPPAAELKAEAPATLTTLKAAPAPEFDKTYIASQIDAHRKVLDMLSTRLIPEAKDADLKALLEELRPTIESHLKEAEAIQQELLEAPAAVEEKPSTPAKK